MKSREDYLRVMHQLEKKKGEIKSSDIAKNLNISKPSVSEMLRKLAKLNLIKIKPYSQVKLTHEGKKYAKKLAYHNETIIRFAKQILKYSNPEAGKLAHELEHLPPQVISKIDNFLNITNRIDVKHPPYIG